MQMIKSWLVVCEVNMNASNYVKLIVKANTQRKAESFAINQLYKRGYFHVKLVSCEELQKGGNANESN